MICCLSRVADPKGTSKERRESDPSTEFPCAAPSWAEPTTGSSSCLQLGTQEEQVPGQSLPCPRAPGGVGGPEESHQPFQGSAMATPLFVPLRAGRQRPQRGEGLLGAEEKTNSNKRSLNADLSLQTRGKVPADFVTSPCVLSRAFGVLAVTTGRAGWLQRTGQGEQLWDARAGRGTRSALSPHPRASFLIAEQLFPFQGISPHTFPCGSPSV